MGFRVNRIHLGAVNQQEIGDLCVSRPSRIKQGSTPQCVARIDVGTFADEPFDLSQVG
jgi:hypothetical protein